MCKRSELEDIIKIVVDIYRKIYGEDIVEIILYGSYARGEEQNDSDIDIVAIVNGERKLLQDALVEVWNQVDDVSIDYETIISPTVIPYQEGRVFTDEQKRNYYNIDKEGIRVA